MIVIDASVVFESLLGVERKAVAARAAVAAAPALHAPHLVDIEVASSIRRAVRSGTVGGPAAIAALTALGAMAVERYPHGPFLPRIHQLRHSITSYDAAYIALAEALDAELVTCDAKLAGANGHRARIRLIG